MFILMIVLPNEEKQSSDLEMASSILPRRDVTQITEFLLSLWLKYNFFEQVLKQKIMQRDLKFYEKAVSAVADPYRMSILQELSIKGEIRCCDVVSLTGLSQPTCSHHIKLLADSELIACRKQGRNNIFTINKENFKKLGQYFEKFGE